MRLAVCLAMCLMAILANAAHTHAQAPSEPQAYCVNRGGDFYLYTGEPCKTGYQLGSGNCRKPTGALLPCQEISAMQWLVQPNYHLKVEDVLKLRNNVRFGKTWLLSCPRKWGVNAVCAA